MNTTLTAGAMTSGEVYRFGDFRLDVEDRRLSRGGSPVRLSPKAYELLVSLVRQAGRLLTKDALLASVWPDVFVEEGTLTAHISALRKALGDERRPATYIETVPKTGYRFIAAVTADLEPPMVTVASRPIELFELVGRGRSYFLSGSWLQLPAAEAAFRAAIALDPEYGPAYAGLALTRCAQAYNRVAPHAAAYAEAKVAALRALAMDPTSADAQVALGTVLFHSEWDWPGAEHSLKRALDLNPDHSEGLLQYGALMDALDRSGSGLSFKQQALERAPHSPLVLLEIALSYWNQRRHTEAITWALKAIDTDPKNPRAINLLAVLYLYTWDLTGLVTLRRHRVTAFAWSDELAAASERWCVALLNAEREGGRRQVLQFLLDNMPPGNGSGESIQRAGLYAALGDPDSAFCHLDDAIADRDPFLVYLAVAPLWDRLRDEPQFNDRLKAMHLPTKVRRESPNI